MSARADGLRTDILIQPSVLRFSLQQDEIVYLFAGDADAQLDRMELMLGIDPTTQSLFDANLGFLPIATTLLIRGERTIVVDPGNHHTGFYGQLGMALRRHGLEFSDVDLVVCTHCHHDHMASIFQFPGADLVLGEGETAFAHELYGREGIADKLARMGPITEVPRGGRLELCPGVTAVSTPGHTPGHISVLVESGGQRTLLTGDATMTRREYEERAFSHWYTSGQLITMNESLDRLQGLDPSLVLPGHDRAFTPRRSRTP